MQKIEIAKKILSIQDALDTMTKDEFCNNIKDELDEIFTLASQILDRDDLSEQETSEYTKCISILKDMKDKDLQDIESAYRAKYRNKTRQNAVLLNKLHGEFLKKLKSCLLIFYIDND